MLITLSGVMRGQAVQIQGGASSLFGGSGAAVTAYFQDQIASLGVGQINGRIMPLASDRFPWKGDTVTLGSQQILAGTDGGGLFLQATGVSVIREAPDRTAGVFLGLTGIGSVTPFFTSSLPQHAGAAAFYRRRVGRFQFDTVNAFGTVKTDLLGGSYSDRHFHLSGTGGLLQGQKYWIGAGTWSPVRLVRLDLSHFDYLDLATSNSAAVSINSAFAFASFSLFNSLFGGDTTNGRGEVIGIRPVRTVSIQAGLFTSDSRLTRRSFETDTCTVNITRHLFAMTGAVKSGQWTGNFGGGYSSNRFSFSLAHSVAFVPYAGGFEQITSASVSVRLRNLSATFQNFLDPQNRMKFAAYGSDWAGEPTEHSRPGPGGKFVIFGRVTDQAGNPVEGIPVTVGKQTLYSNRDGLIYVRVRRSREVSISVSAAVRVIAAPAYAAPGEPFSVVLSVD